MPSIAKEWTVETSAPPREVFAVMEQMIGTPPYRFEFIDETRARIAEEFRNGLFGNWRRVKRGARWVICTVNRQGAGTTVTIKASTGRGPVTRGLQLVHLLELGDSDRRTVYRNRQIPEGPVSLVASWAGMRYALYDGPSYDAARGAEVHTATRMRSISPVQGSFVKVRTDAGIEGWIERDQIVPAPQEATRTAGVSTARFG